jgi:hypothetical protein
VEDTTNWRDHLPKLQPGWRWELVIYGEGKFCMLVLYSPEEEISQLMTEHSLGFSWLFPPDYLEAKDITIKHLRRTAKRILASVDRDRENRLAAEKWK